MRTTLSIHDLQAQSGVAARTLRHWVRKRLMPRPIGRGRGARYDSRHLLRARVVQHLRSAKHSLDTIRVRIDALSDAQLLALLPPPPRALTPEGLPVPPPEPTYPASTWEVIELMDGLVLMVSSRKGPALRRVANEMYRYYGTPK